jgi:CheY-like chemotaxis protein
VARLCTLPGVGPVTATGFAATLDDVKRCEGAKQVRAYLELVPREYGSGERRLRKRNFDVLLSDLMMPEMDGVALLRTALEIDQNLVCNFLYRETLP